MSDKRDYYEVLEISREASADEIKKAFRKKAREYHPDVNKAPEADAMFKELGEAYDVLSDDQKRQVYDTYGHDGLQGGGYQTNWDFMQGFPDLSDLFSSFFGGGFSGGGRQRNPGQGEDLRYDLVIDFMEAAFGVQKEIEFSRLGHCEPCKGSGAAADSGGPTLCPTCGGQGQIRQTTQTIIGHFTQIGTCPRCQGQGQVIAKPCADCQGRGRKEVKQNISLTIPAGVDNGTRLRVGQEGNSGAFGAPSGDLYVFIGVNPHPFFQRDGYDLYASLPVSYSQLALGDTVDVPLLDGTDHIKLHAGTQSGTVFTLKHKGFPVLNAPGQFGHYHIKVVLDVPKKLSHEERKLLEKLKDIEDERKGKASKDSAHAGSLLGSLKAAFT